MGRVEFQGKMVDPATTWWEWFSTSAYGVDKRLRHLFRLLPRDPRCKFCNAPFEGAGGVLVKVLYGKERSLLNPRFCNMCDEASRRFPGGSEVSMSMLFVDIRGSTALSEKMSPTEFSQLINRFYTEASKFIIEEDGLVGKLAGDGVAGFWGAGFAGADYIRRTIRVAENMSKGMRRQKIPAGIGVHAGVAYFGAMGTPDGLTDISAFGDEVNLTARLASQAEAGEIVVSEQALAAAGVDGNSFEARRLELKGISDAVPVRVIKA